MQCRFLASCQCLHDCLRTRQALDALLEAFYEQLSLSTTQQPFAATGDASKSVLHNVSSANVSGLQSFHSTFMSMSVRHRRGKRLAGDEEVRRHVERLLLRLDFNGEFSKHRDGRRARRQGDGEEILRQGGLT